MTTFVLGDVHGRLKALKEVLGKCKFDYKKDKLIVSGDVVDGGYNTYLVVEELLKIKNLVLIMGNHDEWFLNHIKSGWAEHIWLSQGGVNTLRSYGAKVSDDDRLRLEQREPVNATDLNIPVTHRDFFNRAVYWHIEDNMLFVHGGINPKIPKLESQSKHDLLWDRHLIEYAKKHKVQDWDRVFVGHTTTESINGMLEPIRFNNLICMDCGAGWTGKLAIMDIHTEKFWLSKIQKPAIRS